MTNAQYGKLTAGLIAAWFALAISASALQVFKSDSDRPALLLGLAALAPIVLFLAWFIASAGFRRFLLSLDPRTLTIVQSWRVAGFVFIALYAYRVVPGVFALPSGWGDIAIGATAPLVALKLANPDHKRSFILWQALGMSDLVMAVSLGLTARLISPHDAAMGAMTVLPLSLVPVFAVPLFFILHIVCIAQARRWPAREYSRMREQLA